MTPEIIRYTEIKVMPNTFPACDINVCKYVDLLSFWFGAICMCDMASCFDFYSFSGYELLISTIQFILVTILILDINNSIYTSYNLNS